MHCRMHSKKGQHLFHLCCLFLQNTPYSRIHFYSGNLSSYTRVVERTLRSALRTTTWKELIHLGSMKAKEDAACCLGDVPWPEVQDLFSELGIEEVILGWRFGVLGYPASSTSVSPAFFSETNWLFPTLYLIPQDVNNISDGFWFKCWLPYFHMLRWRAISRNLLQRQWGEAWRIWTALHVHMRV